MAGAGVDPHHRFLVRTGREAEDLAALRVEPCALEVHVLVFLDREVRFVRLLQCSAVTPTNPSWTSMNFAMGIPPVAESPPKSTGMRSDRPTEGPRRGGGRPRGYSPRINRIDAVNPCRKFFPATGPISPAAKKPATGTSPNARRTAVTS